LTIDRSTARDTSTRPDDARLREAMKAVAGERQRSSNSSQITAMHNSQPVGKLRKGQ